ncbi:TIGR03087 family PEP-CTERM/XrtA system glycosyltransferase [Thalassoroseus pseudoceratinae]|uniref:TIGR03087 family PEP-CTERM/XrtA system glycosyltransferase n=1 Tax=Thalassoroseus pseudoceratinae TaxID=2713176 RepID=UPI0014227D3F|nr:TIGR03087 family PEP-CTERM/XrtA system glycosyltransferase [Thalassoroseus pseudoceratinae]
MNILYLVHRFPFPPDKGDRIRAFHIIRELSRHHQVHVVTFADAPVRPADEAALAEYCGSLSIAPMNSLKRLTRTAWSLATGGSATCGAFASSGFRRSIREVTSNTDVDCILLSSSGLSRFLEMPELSSQPLLVDFVDVDSQKWADYGDSAPFPKQILYNLESRQLLRVERGLLDRASAVLLVTDAETELCKERCGNGPLYTVTNGVDLDYFQPTQESNDPDGKEGVYSCVFTGAMDYRPNIDAVHWFSHQVWPEIIRVYPSAKFRIVGRNPSRAVTDLKSIHGVQVTGGVTDVRPYLRKATISVAPLRIARGCQNKVLEALASGNATIASSQAAAGLRAKADRDLLVADRPSEWVDGISKLFTSETRRRQLGAAGRDYVVQCHNWKTCLQPLSEMIATFTQQNSCADISDAMTIA